MEGVYTSFVLTSMGSTVDTTKRWCFGCRRHYGRRHTNSGERCRPRLFEFSIPDVYFFSPETRTREKENA